MRLVRGAVLGALTSAALLCTPTASLAGEPGGASAPASEKSGGSEFGVPASVTRPVVSELVVPSSAIPGRPPKVTLRVLERGVGTVNMRVLITNLSTHRTPVIATLNWVHTNRQLTVAWPSSARLAAGVYKVTVSAHDHHNGNLLRSAHSSGEATLTVKAAPKPVVPAPTPTPTPVEPAPEAGVPTPAQTVADGAVFPVQGTHNFGGPENRYGAPRSGHIHQGQDILTAEGTPDLAPLSGTITSTSFQAGGAGYYIVEHTTIGFDLMFAHCEAGSFQVAENQAVTAGQMICKAGQTGDATAPHLHFEMWVGGWQASGGHPIDPLPYLEAWEHPSG